MIYLPGIDNGSIAKDGFKGSVCLWSGNETTGDPPICFEL